MVRASVAFVAAAFAGSFVGVSVATANDFKDKQRQTDEFLQELVDAELFSGVATVMKAGQVLHNQGYGMASLELGTEMQARYRFPIGSNSKFFVAVALNQLHNKRVLDLDDDVANHIGPEDVGLSGPWCPQLHNTTRKACVPVTIRQLLGMSSGIAAQLAGADYNDWRKPFGWTSRSYKLADWDALLSGDASIAEELKHSGLFQAPLQFEPGTTYEYNNYNFVVAAYVVEHLSKMPLREYIAEHIAGPLGLSKTEYDASDGQNSVLTDFLGEHSYLVDFAAAPPKAKRAPWRDSTSSLAVANGAGGVISPASDMVQWFRKFYAEPELLGLSRETMDEMLRPYIAMGDSYGSSFAQGMQVTPGTGTPQWKAPVNYIGGIGGYATSMSLWPNVRDPKSSDVVAFFINRHPVNVPHVVRKDESCVTPDLARKLPTIVCDYVASGNIFEYVLNRLVDIWGLGSWQSASDAVTAIV